MAETAPDIGPGDGRRVRPAPRRIEGLCPGLRYTPPRATSASTTPAATRGVQRLDGTGHRNGHRDIADGARQPGQPPALRNRRRHQGRRGQLERSVSVVPSDPVRRSSNPCRRSPSASERGRGTGDPPRGRGAGRGPPGERRHARAASFGDHHAGRAERGRTGRSHRDCAGPSPLPPRRSARPVRSRGARPSRSSGARTGMAGRRVQCPGAPRCRSAGRAPAATMSSWGMPRSAAPAIASVLPLIPTPGRWPRTARSGYFRPRRALDHGVAATMVSWQPPVATGGRPD